MKVIIQTVKKANVLIDNIENNSIGKGFLILVGFTNDDNIEKVDKMVYKISDLRIFEDISGKINLSIKDIKGELLIVSNFTLYATIKKGFRPSFENALESSKAILLYNDFIDKMKNNFPDKVKTGKFGAYMEVSSINDGPKTFIYEI